MGTAFDKDVTAGCEWLVLQQWQKTVTAHFGPGFNSGSGQQCGSHVFSADQGPGITVRLHVPGPANQERNVGTGVVEGSFSVWQCRTVVAGENNQRVVVNTFLFQYIQHISNGAIEAIDFGKVISQLFAETRQVRPVSGQLQRGGIRPELRIGVPGMVRITEIGPQEKRTIGGFFIEKCGGLIGYFRITAGIQKVDSIGESAEIVFVVDAVECGGISGRTVEVKAAAADAGEVACMFFQQFRQSHFIAWQRS